jgi:hypothetical protein
LSVRRAFVLLHGKLCVLELKRCVTAPSQQRLR